VNALVTGGTGFLGRSLVAKLLAAGWHVRCLVRAGSSVASLRAAVPPRTEDRLEFIESRLDDPNSCQSALAGCTHVFHLAAEMRGATAVLFLTNVIGTRALLQAATRAGVERFVLVSSLGVYDAGSIYHGKRLDESVPVERKPHLRDPYTHSKVIQEQVVWEAHRDAGLPLVVVRPGVIYGPGRDCLSGRVGLRLGGLLVAMGGKQLLPYTHVENCAQAIVLAGTRPGVVGQAFNVIDDGSPTARSLLRQYRRAVGGVRSVTVPGWLIPFVSSACEWYSRKSRGQIPAVLTRYKSRAMWSRAHYANDRAKTMLGWQPEKTFTDGLRETFESLTQERNARTRQQA